MTDVAGVITEGGRNLGRYFGVLSLLPSLLLVLYVYWLFAADAQSGRFSPARGLHAIIHLSAGQIVAVLVAALMVGLVLHPFQFAMTRFLEGYWGTSRIGLRAARLRIMHYRRRARQLDRDARNSWSNWISEAEEQRSTHSDLGPPRSQFRLDQNLAQLDAAVGDAMLASYLRSEAARAARTRYPRAGRRIMPTRLGNVLRRYEDDTGRQYGLDILRLAPHLNLVAAKEHRDYLDDTRKGLDLGVRMCAIAAIATALSLVLLARNGPWLFLALVPYSASYAAYKGAIGAAEEYGTALSTVVDLTRFALYEQLGLPRPPNTAVEKKRNNQLLRMLSNTEPFYLTYGTAAPADAPAAAGPADPS